MFKRLAEEYEYLWDWLLRKGLFVAIIIIDAFLLFCIIIVMILANLFSGKH
jgi:hypothetical protein